MTFSRSRIRMLSFLVHAATLSLHKDMPRCSNDVVIVVEMSIEALSPGVYF